MKCLTVVLCAFLAVSAGNTLPSFFQKCKLNDENLTKCLTESVNIGWPQLIKEDPTWNDVPIDKVEEDIVVASGTLDNGRLIGFADAHFEEVTLNTEKQRFAVVFSCPSVKIVGNSTIKGGVLGLRIDDNYDTNLTFYGGVYNYRFRYNLETRDNETYIHIVKPEMIYNIERMNIDLKTPDKTRDARTNKIFNDNWKILNVLTSGTVGKILAQTITPKIQEFLNDIPFNTLFE